MNHLLISNVTQRDYLLVHIHGWDFHEVASATETCGPREEASSNGWIRKIRKISLLSFISLEPQELNSVVLRTLSFSASSHVRKTLPGGKKGTVSAPARRTLPLYLLEYWCLNRCRCGSARECVSLCSCCARASKFQKGSSMIPDPE